VTASKANILFLCTGNSCRSQMAEGYLRRFYHDRFESFSAGIAPKTLDPRAILVMAEDGIDISNQYSKDVASLTHRDFNMVVTVCGHADENCPRFPGETTVVHVGFDDPPRLAANAASEEEALTHYRRIRDEIKKFIQSFDSFYDDKKELDR